MGLSRGHRGGRLPIWRLAIVSAYPGYAQPERESAATCEVAGIRSYQIAMVPSAMIL
jgi:hypothetical protein